MSESSSANAVDVSPIDEVSNRFVQCRSRPQPDARGLRRVAVGCALDDLSPAGLDARAGLVRDTLAAAQAAPVHADGERLARDVLVERLQLEHRALRGRRLHSSLNVIASPVQDVRMLFDLLPTGTDDDDADLARRMAAVPEALAGYRESLLRGCAAGPGVGGPPGRQVRRAVRHVSPASRSDVGVLRRPRRGQPAAPARSPTS